MEAFLNRYRNLTVLLIVVAAQVLLLGYQVRTNQDVRLVRVWAVTAVTPLARVLEFVRRNTIGIAEDYFVLINVRDENNRLSKEVGRLKLENQFLRTELETAERARALAAFQSRTPSRTIAARVIGNGTGTNSRVVFIDRGSSSGVLSGMAVVTPEGVVGKVLSTYPTASQVLLITDQNFAAGVISQKNRIHGTVKGKGQSKIIVDYVQNEEKVDVGEMFYTSGDDRIFPKGMPVGTVSVVRNGRDFKEIFLVPTGTQNGLEEVLVVVEGVHQTIPDANTVTPSPGYSLLPPPPGTTATPAPDVDPMSRSLLTDADRLRDKYKQIGEAQNHKFGEGTVGSRPPNFNLDPNKVAAPSAVAGAAGTTPGNAPTPGQAAPATQAPRPQTAQTPSGTPPATPRPNVAAGVGGSTSRPSTPSGTAGTATTGSAPVTAPRPVRPAPRPDEGVTGSMVVRDPGTGNAPIARPIAPATGNPAATTPRPVTPSGVGAGTVNTPRPTGANGTAPNSTAPATTPRPVTPGTGAGTTTAPRTVKPTGAPSQTITVPRPAATSPAGSTPGATQRPVNPNGAGTATPRPANPNGAAAPPRPANPNGAAAPRPSAPAQNQTPGANRPPATGTAPANRAPSGGSSNSGAAVPRPSTPANQTPANPNPNRSTTNPDNNARPRPSSPATGQTPAAERTPTRNAPPSRPGARTDEGAAPTGTIRVTPQAPPPASQP
jgi:rod shape-determining protein MreC